jgi:drug/metabolite transporter (DMT)-like permease
MTQTLMFLLLMIPGTIMLGLWDVLTKRILARGIDTMTLQTYSWLLAGILLIPIFFFREIPRLAPDFFFSLAATVVLNTAGQLLFLIAFQKKEASLISPIRLVTTPLVLLTGFFILGEIPSWGGIAGILISFIGLWILLVPEGTRIRNFVSLAVFMTPGIGAALVGSVLLSFSFVFDKKAVLASSGLFFSMCAALAIGITTGTVRILRRYDAPKTQHQFKMYWALLLIIAFVMAAGLFLTNESLRYTFAAYAASVKRLWSLWAILFAGIFLHERKFFMQRIAATLIMLGGIFLIIFFG